MTLLRGVARLSADLGMSVVVEGVETNDQLELISADGAVTEAQGYLFSRAMPPDDVEGWLSQTVLRRKAPWIGQAREVERAADARIAALRGS